MSLNITPIYQPFQKLAQNFSLQQVAGVIVSKAGTVTGTAGVGSSLFLQRLSVGGFMSVSEIQAAMSIAFPATNQGAGTMSRSFVLYSLGNSTSLASLYSVSGTSAWNTGTSTAGASASLTQFQGGWSVPLIQPMTFASFYLSPGEYVVGQLFNFEQASSTWTINFYGASAATNLIASAATNLTSATLGVMSSGGLLAASGITGALGVARYGTQFLALSTAGSMTAFTLTGTASAAASNSSGALNNSVTNTAKSALLNIVGISSNNSIVSNVTLGVNAGSIFSASTAVNAVTNVALGALSSTTLAQLVLPNFGFIGTGSTTSGSPTVFIAGIMSTGAIPTAITLTSTAVTYSGSVAFQQPWFAMVGA